MKDAALRRLLREAAHEAAAHGITRLPRLARPLWCRPQQVVCARRG